MKKLFLLLSVMLTIAFANTASAIIEVGPTVMVTSPNGGETWRVGQERVLTFTGHNIDYGRLAVVLKGQAPGTTVVLLKPCYKGIIEQESDCDNIWYYGYGNGQGSYTVRLPQDTIPGNYKIELAIIDPNSPLLIASDESDQWFSVEPEPVVLAVTQPMTNQTWIAGTRHPVQFFSQGCENQWIQVSLVRVNDYQYGGRYYFAETNALDGGLQLLNGMVPFGLESGKYNLRLDSQDASTYENVSFVDDNVITISSSITSPAAGKTYEAGSWLTVRWAGREYAPRAAHEHYAVYLQGYNADGSGGYYTYRGSVAIEKGQFRIRIPANAGSDGNYRIVLRASGVSGASSDAFSIHNKRRPTPIPIGVKGDVRLARN